MYIIPEPAAGIPNPSSFNAPNLHAPTGLPYISIRIVISTSIVAVRARLRYCIWDASVPSIRMQLLTNNNFNAQSELSNLFSIRGYLISSRKRSSVSKISVSIYDSYFSRRIT